MRTKITLSLLSASLLLAASCKKDDDKNSGSSASNNSWKLNGQTYTATQVARAKQNGLDYLNATAIVDGKAASSVGFVFDTAPTASGNVRVGDGDNQLLIVTTVSNNTTAYSVEGTTKVDASVTVNGGKLTITVPEVWLKNANNLNDSVTFSCNAIAEQ